MLQGLGSDWNVGGAPDSSGATTQARKHGAFASSIKNLQRLKWSVAVFADRSCGLCKTTDRAPDAVIGQTARNARYVVNL